MANGTMTIADAQHVCSTMTDCMGITLGAESDGGKAISTTTPVLVYLKSSDEWVAHDQHLTYLKVRPECEKLKVMRYRRAGGPYCCEGEGCPAENGYAALELACSLPSSTPYGMPACGSLRGEGLQNVALVAEASALSQWGYSENAGLNSVKARAAPPRSRQRGAP
eukprot:3728051-Prymnesium_polylepis.2